MNHTTGPTGQERPQTSREEPSSINTAGDPPQALQWADRMEQYREYLKTPYAKLPKHGRFQIGPLDEKRGKYPKWPVDVNRIKVGTDTFHETAEEVIKTLKPNELLGFYSAGDIIDDEDKNPKIRVVLDYDDNIPQFEEGYCETSVSGTGAHAIVTIPYTGDVKKILEATTKGKHTIHNTDGSHIELFFRTQAVALTGAGKLYTSENPEKSRQVIDAIDVIYDLAAEIAEKKQSKSPATKSGDVPQPVPQPFTRSPDIWKKWAEQHTPVEFLLKHGYEWRGQNRLLSPHSKTGNAGVVLFPNGKFYCHHPDDPLNGIHDVWDCLVTLEYNGDKHKAAKHVLEELGLSTASMRYVAQHQPPTQPSVTGPNTTSSPKQEGPEPKPEENENLPPWERKYPARIFNPDYTCTDDGNARRFIDECKGWLLYDCHSKRWFAWVRNHWEPADEKNGLVEKAVQFVGRTMGYEWEFWIRYGVENNLTEDKNYQKFLHDFEHHIKNSANHRRQVDMLEMARPHMTVDLYDASNLKLTACKNGIIDEDKAAEENYGFYPLEECEQFKYQFPTKYIDRIFNPQLIPEKWNNHLNTVFDDNTTTRLNDIERKDLLVVWARRYFGYLLCHRNVERNAVFLWGEGKNGKSVTTDTLSEVLGRNQAGQGSWPQLFATDTDKPAPAIADSLPKLLMVLPEAGGKTPLSASAFKILTGEKTTNLFRKMKQDNVMIHNCCKPVVTCNVLPRFDKDIDQAILDRIIALPFRHRFVKENGEIGFELVKEADAIFSDMVKEFHMYKLEGLLPVPECAKATRFTLLFGEKMYEFATTQIEPSSETGWMSRKDITDLYINYIAGTEAEDREIKRDKNGNPVLNKDGNPQLKRNYASNLYRLLENLGFKPAKYGIEGFRAQIKIPVPVGIPQPVTTANPHHQAPAASYPNIKSSATGITTISETVVDNPQKLYQAADAADHNITVTAGQYRTTATVIIGAKTADGHRLNVHHIQDTSSANPSADTKGLWEDCLIGHEENTVYWIAKPESGHYTLTMVNTQPEQQPQNPTKPHLAGRAPSRGEGTAAQRTTD